MNAPVETIALRVSFLVSMNSGANVAGASGPYVDQPSTYSQTMIRPNWCQVLADSPNTPVSVLDMALPLTAWLLMLPVTNGPTASTITGTAIATPVA